MHGVARTETLGLKCRWQRWWWWRWWWPIKMRIMKTIPQNVHIVQCTTICSIFYIKRIIVKFQHCPKAIMGNANTSIFPKQIAQSVGSAHCSVQYCSTNIFCQKLSSQKMFSWECWYLIISPKILSTHVQADVNAHCGIFQSFHRSTWHSLYHVTIMIKSFSW